MEAHIKNFEYLDSFLYINICQFYQEMRIEEDLLDLNISFSFDFVINIGNATKNSLKAC